MKVLELYSGIGGMHLALKESGIEGEVLASVDINTNANNVYKHNFPETKLLNRNIQSLTPKFINGLGVNTILMSPPCQPFTRNGKKQDVDDSRTCSFTYLLKILPELEIKFILIENVKGFEVSEMRKNLVDVLEESNFNYQEFILTPTQLGVPNTRHRYYCLAKKLPSTFSFPKKTLLEQFPEKHNEATCGQISSVLENGINDEEYLLGDKILLRHGMVLDICYEHSRKSCCFTKAYGRYVEGTGSVICSRSEEELGGIYSACTEATEKDRLEKMRSLRLRFFTPREVCRLMCFPESFTFPDDTSNKQKYMLLGNSVNIKIVAELIKILNN